MRRGVDLEGLWSRVSLLEIPEENRVVSRLGDPVELRMTVGHHTHLLSEADRSRLVDSLYTVSQESDRMGFRLEGPPLESLRGLGRVPSFAVDRGFVQVPPEGRPIILMADSQTTGGYAVVGVVLPPDVDLLAQCVPGTRVRLRFINISTAEEVVRSYLSYLEKPRTEEVSEGFSEYDLHT
ncbi:MAG: hypothetical protein DRO39_08290 [Thermoprotei archaeon]|nr:MAG: hypothetical protein DRO39_08290 [Thermoprotei archaeon]